MDNFISSLMKPLYYLSTVNQYLGKFGIYSPHEVIEADHLEKVWQNSQKNLTSHELVNLFLSEESEKDKLLELEEYYQYRVDYILKIKKQFDNQMALHPIENRPLWRAWYDGLLSVMNEEKNTAMLESISMKIKLFKNKKKSSNKKSQITNKDISDAKQYPIDRLISFNHQRFAKCIWHNDSHPSMYYYSKTNTIYCFSCNHRGDSIEVIKQIHSLDFIEAVKFLTK